MGREQELIDRARALEAAAQRELVYARLKVHSPQAQPAKLGSGVPVIQRAPLDLTTAELTIDPTKHCIFVSQTPNRWMGF